MIEAALWLVPIPLLFWGGGIVKAGPAWLTTMVLAALWTIWLLT